MTNRDKTKESALKLFNEMGYANVRLQHISDDCLVSVGNMAYHFKNKQAILKAVYEDLAQRHQSLLSDLNQVPIFDYMDEHFQKVYRVVETYQFFYLDTNDIIRSDEEIALKYTQYLKWEKEQLIQVFRFNVSRGSFLPMSDDTLAHLSELISLIKQGWVNPVILKDPEANQRFKTFIWDTLYPYFSERGVTEYEQMRKLHQTNW